MGGIQQVRNPVELYNDKHKSQVNVCLPVQTSFKKAGTGKGLYCTCAWVRCDQPTPHTRDLVAVEIDAAQQRLLFSGTESSTKCVAPNRKWLNTTLHTGWYILHCEPVTATDPNEHPVGHHGIHSATWHSLTHRFPTWPETSKKPNHVKTNIPHTVLELH